ncbi:MAG: hypothetical protein ACRDQ0_20655 [Pseudonocardia sp.]
MSTFVRWGLPPLVLVLASFGLFAMVGASRVDLTPDRVQVFQGTVSAYRQGLYEGFERSVERAHLVTLAERPQNVEFFLEEVPTAGIARGDSVRLELLEDPRFDFGLGEDNPRNTYQVRAVGLSVHGQVVYSAGATLARAETAIRGYTTAGVLALTAAVAWAGLGAYRHRVELMKRLRAEWPEAMY